MELCQTGCFGRMSSGLRRVWSWLAARLFPAQSPALPSGRDAAHRCACSVRVSRGLQVLAVLKAAAVNTCVWGFRVDTQCQLACLDRTVRVRLALSASAPTCSGVSRAFLGSFSHTFFLCLQKLCELGMLRFLRGVTGWSHMHQVWLLPQTLLVTSALRPPSEDRSSQASVFISPLSASG